MRIVMKFGGTSMAGAERIRPAAGLAMAGGREHEVVTVVSAMDGMTEKLLELAEAAGVGKHARVDEVLSAIRADHEEGGVEASGSDRGKGAREGGAPEVVAPLLSRLEALARGVAAVEELTARSRD